MISPGQKIDLQLELKVVQAGSTRAVKLGELLKRRTIVSVYMRNNTPSCDRQNDQLAAHAAEWDRAGCDVIALSRDTCGSHVKYAAAKKIPYVLASDPEDRFARAADAIVEKTMYGRKFLGPARAAFVLERDGTVLAVLPKIESAEFAAQLRALLATV